MRKYRALLKGDIQQVVTDPMLMASIIGPIVLVLIARYLFPPLDIFLMERYAFSLGAHEPFAASVMLTVIPLLTGTMAGLLMLDDRDANMIAYYSVTPLSREGYFRYRLILPCLLTLIMCGLFLSFSGMSGARAESLPAIVPLVLEAPLMALFLTAFASNKVEGLALSKASVVLFAGPIAANYIPEPWSYLGSAIPS